MGFDVYLNTEGVGGWVDLQSRVQGLVLGFEGRRGEICFGFVRHKDLRRDSGLRVHNLVVVVNLNPVLIRGWGLGFGVQGVWYRVGGGGVTPSTAASRRWARNHPKRLSSKRYPSTAILQPLSNRYPVTAILQPTSFNRYAHPPRHWALGCVVCGGGAWVNPSAAV